MIAMHIVAGAKVCKRLVVQLVDPKLALRSGLHTAGLLTLIGCATPALAEPAVACGGFALLGGAQISCSHVAPSQPTQFCTFSWALVSADNTPKVVEGSFLIVPGATNVSVYQGTGYASALSNPIVLCQGKKSR